MDLLSTEKWTKKEALESIVRICKTWVEMDKQDLEQMEYETQLCMKGQMYAFNHVIDLIEKRFLKYAK